MQPLIKTVYFMSVPLQIIYIVMMFQVENLIKKVKYNVRELIRLTGFISQMMELCMFVPITVWDT